MARSKVKTSEPKVRFFLFPLLAIILCLIRITYTIFISSAHFHSGKPWLFYVFIMGRCCNSPELNFQSVESKMEIRSIVIGPYILISLFTFTNEIWCHKSMCMELNDYTVSAFVTTNWWWLNHSPIHSWCSFFYRTTVVPYLNNRYLL
jgi:hypothetical protein